MTAAGKTFVVFPGAGNERPDPALFINGADASIVLEIIYYPDWHETARHGYDGTSLVTALANEAERRVPTGPVRLIGISIGGHLGYAVVLELISRGRAIGGFTAVDTYFDWPPEPALKRRTREAWSALATGSPRMFSRYVRSHFWRRYLRRQEPKWSVRLSEMCGTGSKPRLMQFDTLVEFETNMRLVIQHSKGLISKLSDARPIEAPALLLRTAASRRDDGAWRRRFPRIEIAAMPGTHDKMFDPAVMDAVRPRFEAVSRTWA